MKSKNAFVFLLSLFLFLVLCLVSVLIFINPLEKNYFSGEIISCNVDNDCNDGNSCTINYCKNLECEVAKVVLCYDNDNCCPKGCVLDNDNDCLN